MNKKFVESLQSTVLTRDEIFVLLNMAEKYKVHKDDDFIDSVLNYIEQNKNKLTTYSYDDIQHIVINSKFDKYFDHEGTVIECVYNLINCKDPDFDKDNELYHIGKNFSYVDGIYDTIKQAGLHCRYLVFGAFGFMSLIQDLTDVA